MGETIAEAIEKKIKKEFPKSNVKVESFAQINEGAYYGCRPIKTIKADIEISGMLGPFIEDLQDKSLSGYHVINTWLDDVGMMIEKVVFHDPATIVYWRDGSKTVVKCSEDEEFDPEKGLAMAISKKALGNSGRYYEEFKKWLPEPEEKYHEALSRNMKKVEELKPSWKESMKAMINSLRNVTFDEMMNDLTYIEEKED